jgi:hypothetical protein
VAFDLDYCESCGFIYEYCRCPPEGQSSPERRAFLAERSLAYKAFAADTDDLERWHRLRFGQGPRSTRLSRRTT